MRVLSLSLALLVLLLSGCSADKSRVVVDLSVEEGLLASLAEVDVQIRGAQAAGAFEDVEMFSYALDGSAFQKRFVMGPQNEDASRQFELQAVGRTSDGSQVSRTLRGRYIEGEVRTLTVVLEQSCLDVDCGERTCSAGVCVDPRQEPEPDAGVDAGTDVGTDVGVDATPCMRSGDEICDGVDNDCNGRTDEGDLCGEEICRGADGCMMCVPSDDDDEPDADGMDTNCDGVDGDASRAVFVRAGSTGVAGTLEDPVGTIAEALTIVSAAKDQMYIAEGTYNETPIVSANVHIFGGYGDSFRTRGPAHVTTIQTGAEGVTFVGATSGLHWVTIESADATRVGGLARSSATVRVTMGSSVDLEGCVLRPGDGADAASAPPPDPPRATPISSGGSPGVVFSGIPVEASAGGDAIPSPCMESTGGSGGRSGRFRPAAPEPPRRGVGERGGAPGENGTSCFDLPLGGGPGDSGERGANGNHGDAGGALGRLTEVGAYNPPLLQPGSQGDGGTGGGGGGGGGSIAAAADDNFVSGGGGGAGGAGGCGGDGGAGGLSGGGSFGVVVIDSTVSVVGTRFELGTGGRASDGVAGASGANGATGGPGGVPVDLPGCATGSSGTGGNGGEGGDGGRGGSGAGGTGGPSIAILLESSEQLLSIDASGITEGMAGAAGRGGPGGESGTEGLQCLRAAATESECLP